MQKYKYRGLLAYAPPVPLPAGAFLSYTTCDCPLDRQVLDERHCADVRDYTCAASFDVSGPRRGSGTQGVGKDGGVREEGGVGEGATQACEQYYEFYGYRGGVDGDAPCLVLLQVYSTLPVSSSYRYTACSLSRPPTGIQQMLRVSSSYRYTAP